MKSYGGHSMVSELRRILVCSPQSAGWDESEKAENWPELGYFRPPNVTVAETEHQHMTALLEKLGVEVVSLSDSEGLSLDAVYAHDASLMTEFGAILMRMGKMNRAGEPDAHAKLLESLDVPILGAIEPPGVTEAGDIVWLNSETLLVGRGYRTNESGIEQLYGMLRPKGVEVLTAPLPHGPGPDACLHLMSLMSLLDTRTVLVDLAWLSVPTVELLDKRGFDFVEIDSSERQTMACNVLALGKNRILALEENPKTNERLREKGFVVGTFSGSELCQNGSGGPTCLTRPLWRG
jgi:N-dimethylarginine dimethylaminohydrolase